MPDQGLDLLSIHHWLSNFFLFLSVLADEQFTSFFPLFEKKKGLNESNRQWINRMILIRAASPFCICTHFVDKDLR